MIISVDYMLLSKFNPPVTNTFTCFLSHFTHCLISFFLSETCKYLFLLFDTHNFVRRGRYVFNTEGHLLRIPGGVRTLGWLREATDSVDAEINAESKVRQFPHFLN